VPLCIDSSVPGALEAGLMACEGRPLLNSVTGEEERLELVLPLVKKYNVPVVAISNDDTGISEDPDVRFAVAKKIVERAADFGIPAHDIVVDPLVMPVGAMATAGQQVFALVRRLREELGVNTTCGASNISFGLPHRHGINGAFLPMAIGAGMTSAIMNPVRQQEMEAIRAANFLMNHDPNGGEWIRFAKVLTDGRRLGCQAKVMGDVVIDVPPESQVHKQVIRKSATERDIVMDPATRCSTSRWPSPTCTNPPAISSGLPARCATSGRSRAWRPTLAILRRLQPALRKGEWKVTVALHQGHHDARPRILDIWPGFHEGGFTGWPSTLGPPPSPRIFAICPTDRSLPPAGVMNPQIRFGEDLMSRVSYAMMNPGGDVEMTGAVREALDTLIKAIAPRRGSTRRRSTRSVFVCNPVMHHLLLGIDPVELGRPPLRWPPRQPKP
jgi:hypothetical protein